MGVAKSRHYDDQRYRLDFRSQRNFFSFFELALG
jgi:hypothetical protein